MRARSPGFCPHVLRIFVDKRRNDLVSHFGSRFGSRRILFLRAEGRRGENAAAAWPKVRSRQSAMRLFTKSQPNSNNLPPRQMYSSSFGGFGEIFTPSLRRGHHFNHTSDHNYSWKPSASISTTFEICMFPIPFGLRGYILVGLFGDRLARRKIFFSFVVHE